MSNTNVLVITVDSEPRPYAEGLEAIQQLKEGKTIEGPAVVRFPNESQLTDVFNERTYTLLRIIRDEEPASIRETARLVDRDKKRPRGTNDTQDAGCHPVRRGRPHKKPVFPYVDLVVTPLAGTTGDGTPTTP